MPLNIFGKKNEKKAPVVYTRTLSVPKKETRVKIPVIKEMLIDERDLNIIIQNEIAPNYFVELRNKYLRKGTNGFPIHQALAGLLQIEDIKHRLSKYDIEYEILYDANRDGSVLKFLK